MISALNSLTASSLLTRKIYAMLCFKSIVLHNALENEDSNNKRIKFVSYSNATIMVMPVEFECCARYVRVAR